jgi:hypothetical protein
VRALLEEKLRIAEQEHTNAKAALENSSAIEQEEENQRERTREREFVAKIENILKAREETEKRIKELIEGLKCASPLELLGKNGNAKITLHFGKKGSVKHEVHKYYSSNRKDEYPEMGESDNMAVRIPSLGNEWKNIGEELVKLIIRSRSERRDEIMKELIDLKDALTSVSTDPNENNADITS